MNDDYRKGPDHYAIQAKKEGYPARSVYKLKEMQEKFHILRCGDRVLDIGAAPGSWSLYAVRETGPSGSVVSVDLGPLSLPNTPKNIVFLQGDAFEGNITARLRDLGPFDVVLSDAAPRTTGNRTVDAGRSFQIAGSVIDLAADLLKEGGNIAVKIFQGGDEPAILARLRGAFGTSRGFKPKASRKTSFETYCIGLGMLRGRSSGEE